MKRRKATQEELERLAAVRAMPCIACQIFGVYNQPFPTEVHHQNLGGKAGQRRLGHMNSVPLCSWHHVGTVTPGVNSITMNALYGPSLARQSKRFRERYGTDDELLARVNALLNKSRAA